MLAWSMRRRKPPRSSSRRRPTAVQQKRFNDAVDLYDQALEIAPWWPAGRYNRGLILGELKDYEGAIGELKRYLKIDPDAANARAVQLKIYEWEGMLPKAAK